MPVTTIFGPSGSGKTSLAEHLRHTYGYKKIVTYTTRPRRKGERSGVSYYFLSHKEFADKIENGFFAEYTSFSPHGVIQWYGTSRDSLLDAPDKSVLVLEPSGIKSLLEQGYPLRLVYLNEDQTTCVLHLHERGDDIVEIARRMAYDLPLFRELEVYLKMHDISYLEFKNMSICEIAERIDNHDK